jgi:cholesterol transport system auxiliary component
MAMTRPLPVLILVLMLPLLAACGPLAVLRTAAQPLEAYTLRAAAFQQPAAATGRHILVEPPAASGAIDTDRILVKPSPLQVQYLVGARWIDPAPELVQTLLVETLQNTGSFRYVTRTATGLFPDYTLLSELVDFQAEVTGDETFPITTRVTLNLALVREADGQIVSSRRFTAARQTTAAHDGEIIAAFNATTDQVLREASAWLLSLFGIRAAS